jgi:hypothetical protein
VTVPGRQEPSVLGDLHVALDADTRLVIAPGDPQPGNRNDTIVYRASGIDRKVAGRDPYREPRDGSELPAWKQDYNTGHRKIRARVEHALALLKTYRILRDDIALAD